MTMELARFRIHEGAEALLLAERPAMVEALRRRFPGCLAAYLTREDGGGWLDVVLWRSRAEAEEAAHAVNSVPECAAWFRHIAESGGLRHVEVMAVWEADDAGPGHRCPSCLIGSAGDDAEVVDDSGSSANDPR